MSEMKPDDLVAVPRWVFDDFLNNQPGWPDTARRYKNAPALAAAPVSSGVSGGDQGSNRKGDLPTEGHGAAVLADEPVAWRYRAAKFPDEAWIYGDYALSNSDGWYEIEPLYARQQAPISAGEGVS